METKQMETPKGGGGQAIISLIVFGIIGYVIYTVAPLFIK